ncbi:hypothetical protein J7E73_04770 [Paenibacillus albidus]|uniref:hypothetical protein n=1 Tax=Paenibacillus albidus TaxID=2041023 RepID=UPI001BEC2D17|nr:hypothetical protein [Paenibacillus albidus]MBT2288457.1 hypothetical protein [Paenibacillus albidus]
MNVPETVDSAFTKQVAANFHGVAGDWSITDDVLLCESPYAFAGCITEQPFLFNEVFMASLKYTPVEMLEEYISTTTYHIVQG